MTPACRIGFMVNMKQYLIKHHWLFIIIFLTLAISSQAADNELSAAEREAGWILLFDGKTQVGWMTSGQKPSETPVEEGSI
jgi:hypothetical protein